MMSKIRTIHVVSFAAILLIQSIVAAGDGCRKSCCPKCETPCVLKIEEGTETKHCWKIEEKTVCIPRVTFSWQWPFQKKAKSSSSSCCSNGCDAGCCKPSCKPPKLARSRTVRVLVKHEFECPVCKYKWEAKESTPCAAQCDSEMEVYQTSVVPQPEQPKLKPASATRELLSGYFTKAQESPAPVVVADKFPGKEELRR